MRQPRELRAALIEGRAGQGVGHPRSRDERAGRIVGSRGKRVLDIVLASAGLLVLSPLLAGVAIAIRLDSPGPVIFRQHRHGLNGRVFTIYKFRTMTSAASAADFRQATLGDERVTRLGRLLRRTNVDELPQLLNVVLGDMSLVGPRPHPMALDSAFADRVPDLMRRYAVRPGLTGWAQVHGLRGETATVEAMAERVRHDLDYVRAWSIRLDLLIMIRTLWDRASFRNAG